MQPQQTLMLQPNLTRTTILPSPAQGGHDRLNSKETPILMLKQLTQYFTCLYFKIDDQMAHNYNKW